MDIITAGTTLAIASKLLGKTAEEISKDIAGLYSKGRDKIIEVANRKIVNIDDGKQANLRVARDVFWGGSFTDEAICAEYFGGILASARSEDGKDDAGVYYVDIIKSLSSAQLHLHYVIYRSLNKSLILDVENANINVGLSSSIHKIKFYFFFDELISLGLKLDTDLECLYRKGLLHEYKYETAQINNKILNYVMITPTTLGVQLFSIANNMLSHWRNYPTKDFGDFQDIQVPQHFEMSLEKLAEQIEK